MRLCACTSVMYFGRYTGNIGCAVGGSSAWCFCNLTWTWSASAEVFGLNNFFTVSLIYLMAVFQDTTEEKKPGVTISSPQNKTMNNPILHFLLFQMLNLEIFVVKFQTFYQHFHKAQTLSAPIGSRDGQIYKTTTFNDTSI